MLLNEFFKKEPSGYQDVNDDNSQPSLGSLRKTKLTLAQLNKLRRMNDLRRFEYSEKLKKIQKQYATPAPAL
jgi:hypothetical protein